MIAVNIEAKQSRKKQIQKKAQNRTEPKTISFLVYDTSKLLEEIYVVQFRDV